MSSPKRVKIADLKAHLSAHLRAVRAGDHLTIVDRETPIAELVPLSAAGTPPPLPSIAPTRRRHQTDLSNLQPLNVDLDRFMAEERADRL